MSFTVHELPRAKADKRCMFRWLVERSPKGAAAWLNAYDALLRRLEEHAESFEEAQENQDCDFDVRQGFFKTRRGRVYRALLFIEGEHVYVLRVRGPGQAPVEPDDMGGQPK